MGKEVTGKGRRMKGKGNGMSTPREVPSNFSVVVVPMVSAYDHRI